MQNFKNSYDNPKRQGPREYALQKAAVMVRCQVFYECPYCDHGDWVEGVSAYVKGGDLFMCRKCERYMEVGDVEEAG